MRSERAYLDHNATTPLRPAARIAMIEALDATGNPSSVHTEGRRARAHIEMARQSVARLVDVPTRGIVFTSGGTEAANLALTPSLGAAGRKDPEWLLISAVEHPCVLAGHRFPADKVRILPVDREGRLDLAALDAALQALAPQAVLLALQGANNETGVIQPVAEAAARVHAHGGYVFCDAVQVAGRRDIGATTRGADMVALSGHKIGGPMGTGALAFCDATLHLQSMTMRGGGQERGMRAGTENVAAIVGFGAAARDAMRCLGDDPVRLDGMRKRLEQAVLAQMPEAVILSGGASRLPNTLCLAVPYYTAETMLMAMDLEGVAISSGSACSSGKVGPSHVLSAMGVAPDLARSALRISLGWSTTDADIDQFIAAFSTICTSTDARRVAA